jgi:hypothetical protein
MSNAMQSGYQKIYEAAQAADDAWQAELIRLFGKKASDVRYQPASSGQEGSELRRLYLEFRRTSNALQAAWEAILAAQREARAKEVV